MSYPIEPELLRHVHELADVVVDVMIEAENSQHPEGTEHETMSFFDRVEHVEGCILFLIRGLMEGECGGDVDEVLPTLAPYPHDAWLPIRHAITMTIFCECALCAYGRRQARLNRGRI